MTTYYNNIIVPKKATLEELNELKGELREELNELKGELKEELNELREEIKYMPPQHTVCSECGVKNKLREGGKGYQETMQNFEKRSKS